MGNKIKTQEIVEDINGEELLESDITTEIFKNVSKKST